MQLHHGKIDLPFYCFPSPSLAPPSSPSPVPTVIVVVVVVDLISPHPLARRPLLATWSGGAEVAARLRLGELTKKVNLPGIDFCRRRRALLRLLHPDDQDGVALSVPPLV